MAEGERLLDSVCVAHTLVLMRVNRKRAIAILTAIALVACMSLLVVWNARRAVVTELGRGYRLKRVRLSETATRLALVRYGAAAPMLVTEAIAENGMIVSLLTTPVSWGRSRRDGNSGYMQDVCVDTDSSVIDISIGDGPMVTWGNAFYSLVDFERAYGIAGDVSGAPVVIVTTDLPAKEKVMIELMRILATLSPEGARLAFRAADAAVSKR